MYTIAQREVNRMPKPLNESRILVIRLSAIGDVLHASNVVHNLKRHAPGCHVTWLASPPASELLEGNPDIDRLLVWDRRPMDAAFGSRHFLDALSYLKEARALLKPYAFDLTLDLQGLFLTGILARFSGAARRIGIHERHEGNSFFMTEMAPDTGNPHKIHRYMTALEPLGITDSVVGTPLSLPHGMQEFAQEFWLEHGILPSHPILMVNVRTTWPDKNWSPKSFGTALQSVPSSVQVVFCGAGQDVPYVEEAQKYVRRTLSIAGETSLMELAALFRSATLLLSGDTGPLYIAEAVGLSTLSLWGPTSPDIYGPLTKGHHFIRSAHSCTGCCKRKCRHKTNACMRAIRPEVVAEKLRELLVPSQPST